MSTCRLGRGARRRPAVGARGPSVHDGTVNKRAGDAADEEDEYDRRRNHGRGTTPWSRGAHGRSSIISDYAPSSPRSGRARRALGP
jgi:hypothetical protein